MRISESIMKEAQATAARLPKVTSGVFLLLGSAQSEFANSLEVLSELPFGGIPALGAATAPGHSGRLIVCRVAGESVVICAGRRHLYEMDRDLTPVIFPAILAAEMGCETLVLTNAAGSMQPNRMPIGTIAALSDHVNLTRVDPMRGEGARILGVERSNGMGTTYDPTLRALVKSAGKEVGLSIPEAIYIALSGPSFETPAEIRMCSELGDLVGMSTVPEAMVWQALSLKSVASGSRKMRLLALSVVTNLAQGLSDQEVSVEEVLSEGKNSAAQFSSLLNILLPRLFTVRT